MVTNPGGRDLLNVVVTDDQGVTVTCPATTLPAGTSMNCTGSGTAIEGQYSNIGTVNAELLNGTPVSASDPSHYFGQAVAAVTLEKSTNGFEADTPPGPSLPLGSPVTWTYVVTNVGTDPLSNIEVTDDQGVVVTCPVTDLAPGESMTCTGSGTAVPGQYSNIGSVIAMLPDESTTGATDLSQPWRGSTPTKAVATATLPSLEQTSASDLSHYFGIAPSVSATKSVALVDQDGDNQADPGDTLAYTVVLTNSGGATAIGAVFTDTPDANTALIAGSVTTTAGSVVAGNTAGDTAVQVAVGDLAGSGGTATITFQVTIDDPLPDGVQQISNQGSAAGGNFATVSTDDPAAPGAADPTVISVQGANVIEIPALGTWGLLALLLLLGGLGVRSLARGDTSSAP